MTLILAVTTPKAVWLCADRRLSVGARVYRDDACKLIAVDCTDGSVLIGYAGLGETAGKVEPSTWMYNTLTGLKGTVAETLTYLANRMVRQFPLHLARVARAGNVGGQLAIAVGFAERQPALYVIKFVVDRFGRPLDQALTRYVRPEWSTHGQRGVQFATTGSGALHFQTDRLLSFRVKRAAKAYGRGVMPAAGVARELARLNHLIHSRDRTVGPRCTVVWRLAGGGGGGHQAFDGVKPDQADAVYPSLANGVRMSDIAGVMLQAFVGALGPDSGRNDRAAAQARVLEAFQSDDVNRALANIPNKPDDTLS